MEFSTAQLMDAGVAVSVLTAIGYFIDRRFWPWFTEQYWPLKQRQAEAAQTVLTEIRDAIVSIQALFTTNAEDRRETTRQLGLLVDGQTAINNRLDSLHAPLLGGGSGKTGPLPPDLVERSAEDIKSS